MAELVLSASSVDAYESCHYRWYLSYIEMHAGQQSVAAARGLAVHAAIEAYYRDQLALGWTTSGDLSAIVDVYDTAFLLETADIADPEEDLGKARIIGRRALHTYLEDVAPSIEPRYVEEPGRLLVNGIDFSYHIDLIDSVDVVHDTKIKRAKPRDPGRYAFQINGYALAFRAITGGIERDVVLDVIIALKRNRPYHVPYRNGGPVTRTAIGMFAAQLEQTAEGIDRADFEPTGLVTGACKWCPVKTVCEPYQRMEELRAS